MTPPPPNVPSATKKQKREEYRRKLGEQTTIDGEVKMPQKKFFRQRAHANVFSDHKLEYPRSPNHMDWSSHYPAFIDQDPSHTNLDGNRKLLKDVEVVDIGCGFGGLLVGLAPLLPETLILGMEIRTSVSDYVRSRVGALRLRQQQLKSRMEIEPSTTQEKQSEEEQTTETLPDADADADAPEDEVGTTNALVPGNYENISGLRANTMKFLPNFFNRAQLSKIFICFPDPHFKARKHKARIVSESLNAEYAYLLRPGGKLYSITDVEEYHHWILRHFIVQEGEDVSAGSSKFLWERVEGEELEQDPCVTVMSCETEESKKVSRNKGNKHVAVFRRKENPEWPA
ncbi:tRNA (guanine-N(7)-)-methyltransferase [Penicillium verhagenii]|uniref:tRNA (guanine-N(7)-)-methyltransferase n=1 Tax=Penicillium verhagenii TaxID=1562060 RepID=UPI002545736D|nr:tRNA (guanine-N(7)-)-methyltransferase [Penicillium verhagenii]KAJ5935404.1 tRNA (guanine-N(7)-)-methyltransferase [Penicillium verhagenii]